MKLTKLGDCLSYGLTHELMKFHEVTKMEYLKSSYIYLYLKEFLGVSAINELKAILEKRPKGSESAHRLFERSVRVLSLEFKKKITFNTFEELVNVLNHYTVPEWIYHHYEDIYAYVPELYWVEDMLYYIHKENFRYSFRRINVSCARTIHFSDWDGMEDEEGYNVISNRYMQILGRNKALGIIYLRPIHMQKMYVEYYIDSGQELIVHEKCLGVMGDNVIVEKDNFIMAKKGQKYKKLWEFNEMESYSIEANEIYVSPRFGKPVMFKPFRVGLGGEKISVSYVEARDYLWNQMEETFSYMMLPFSESQEEEVERNEKIQINNFCLGDLINYFEKRNSLISDKRTRICYFIIQKLSKYIDLNTDVLDIFYVLYDASKKHDEYSWSMSISEQVYWRIIELDEEGELEKCIRDLGKFKQKLLEDAYWNEESLKSISDYNLAEGKIGFFEFTNKKMIVESISKECGVLVGSTIMMRGSSKEGSVSYNIDTGEYQIQYSRLLTNSQIRNVVENFNLEDRPYHILIETKEG